MKLTLYGFHICPFAERTRIMLREKNISCEQVHVDIRNKPAWFADISPTGNVPILKVDDTVLFEAAVIVDFLDAIAEQPSIYPSDPIQKAHNQSWIAWGSGLLHSTFNMSMAKNEETQQQHLTQLHQKLELLEKTLANQPYFNGDAFSVIDMTYAPLFRRLDCLEKLFSINSLSQYPKATKWFRQLMERPSVKQTFVDNFEEELQIHMKFHGSCLA